MYYIQTADRLTRTSVWLEKMDGGIDYLRDVIVNDRLGIAADLERQMEFLVDTYKCEWAEVVRDPEKRRLFKQFVPTIEFVKERQQKRPADWNGSFVPSSELQVRKDEGGRMKDENVLNSSFILHSSSFVFVGKVWEFPEDGGATIRYGKTQIAVYRFASRGEWYATQNMCPHKREFVLSRGLLGDQNGTPKVACPLHKKTFSLETGECLSGEDYRVTVFPVKVDGVDVYVQLPSAAELDATLATAKTCNRAHACELQTV
jgi:nitrite reductase (NADH) large subunit